MPFEVGDVVMLRSGGPHMTVEQVDGNIVSTVWFDESQHLRRQQFNPCWLKRAVP